MPGARDTSRAADPLTVRLAWLLSGLCGSAERPGEAPRHEDLCACEAHPGEIRPSNCQFEENDHAHPIYAF